MLSIINESVILFMIKLYCFFLPGGSGWIISVGDYADNSFTALWSSDPREVRLELSAGFIFYLFKSILFFVN